MNKRMGAKSYLTLLVIFLPLFAYSQSKLRTWKTDSEFDPKFKKILVLGMIESVSLRSDVEDAIVDQAVKDKVQARMGLSMFPPEMGNPFEDPPAVRKRLQEKGFDVLMTVAFFSTTANRYIPPEKVYVPVGYYNRFGTYYRNSYSVYQRPGYMTTQSKYFIECNLYQIKDGMLIWSARTYAFPQESVDSSIKKFSKKLFKELKAQEVIVVE